MEYLSQHIESLIFAAEQPITLEEMSAGVANLFELLKASGAMEAYTSLMDDYAAGSRKYAPLKEAVGVNQVSVSNLDLYLFEQGYSESVLSYFLQSPKK